MAGLGKVRARANIALAKYWGKNDDALNLPAVPSLSVTLDPMVTETTVRLDPRLEGDVFLLDGKPALDEERERVTELLDRLRAETGESVRAHVESKNDFPTASGLASSASGFAALAGAARDAFGLPRDAKETSRLARRSSASAARSVFEGFVELPAGVPGDDSLAAYTLFERDHLAIALVIAVVTEDRKAVASRAGMGHSRRSSPYYDAWVDAAPRLLGRVREGLALRDLDMLGQATEASFGAMHALALSTSPPTFYFLPASLAVLHRVRALREGGLGLYTTMDAGPHVKTLCHEQDVDRVSSELRHVDGVIRVLVARPGLGLEHLD